jgi:hypothetical protein
MLLRSPPDRGTEMPSRVRGSGPSGLAARPPLPAELSVRLFRSPGAPIGDVSGVVEWPATGELREFRSAKELLRVLREWGDG